MIINTGLCLFCKELEQENVLFTLASVDLKTD